MSDFAQFADLVVSLQAKDGEKVVGTFKTVVKEGEKVSTTFYKVGSEAEKAGKGAKKLNDELTASSGRLKVIGRDINRYITLPFIAFTAASTKFALDLNKGMAAVATNLTGTTDRIYELRDAIREISASTGRSFNDLTEGLYEFTSVFDDTEDTVANFSTAVRVAQAGISSAGEAVNLLSAVTRAFGDTSVYTTKRVADMAFEAVRLGAVTVPQLSAAMQVATDRADRLNVSQEELFTVFATLTGITGDAAMVATQFRSAMDSILNPTDELIELFKQMGYETGKQMLAQEGLLGTMLAINNAAIASGKPLQDYITRKEGMTIVSRLATSQLDDFQDKLQDVALRTGALNDAEKAITDGIAKFNHQLAQNRQAIASAASVIGESLLPVLVAVTGTVSDLLLYFSSLPPEMQAVLLSSVALVASLTGLFQIMGAIESLKIAKVFSSLPALFTSSASAAAALGTALKGVFGILGLVAFVATSVGIAQSNSQRQFKEAIDNSNDALELQIQRLREFEELQSRLDTVQNNLVSVRAQQFLQQGSIQIPNLDTLGRNTDLSAGSHPGTRYTTRNIKNLTQQEREDLRTRLEELKEEYTSGLARINNTIDQSNRQLSALAQARNILNRDLSDFPQRLDEILGKPGFLNLQRAGFPRAYGYSGIVEALGLSDDDPEKINKLRDSIESLRITVFPVFGRGVGSEDQKTAYREFLEIAQNYLSVLENTAEQERINSNAIQQKTNIYTDDFLVSLEAGIKLLDLQTTGIEANSRAIAKATPTWQEWFAKMSDVNGIVKEVDDSVIVLTTTASAVGQAVANQLNTEFQNALVLAEITGQELEKSVFREDQLNFLSDMISQVLNDGLIEGMSSAEQRELNSSLSGLYKDTNMSMLVDLGQEQAQSWEDQQQALDFYNNTLDEYRIKLEKATLDQSFWEDELKKSIEILRLATVAGLDPASEAYQALTNNVQKSKEELAKFNEESGKTLIVFNTFSDVMDDLFDLDTAVQNSLFDFFSTDRADEIKKEIRDLEVSGNSGTKAVKKQIAELTEELFKLEAVGAVVADIFGNVLQLAMQGLIDSFYDLGKAIASGGDGWDSFKTSLENTLITIAKAIPDLLIAGGIQLLGVNPAVGIALILAGLAGKAFVGYAEGLAGQEGTYGPASGTITPMSDGGLINHSMQYGRNIIGEAGPELLFPATRTTDGQLAVRAVDAGSGGVEINVFNNASDQVQTRQQEEPDGSITLIIEKVVQGIATSGGLNRALQTQFVGLRTRGEN